MEKPLISVIVPVYKVEPYLDTCVQSLLHQTHANLEILLVDDGSPDRCPELCDAYARNDRRVRVIHKKNGGIAAARNTGLEAAAGTLIGFVDSDDYAAPDMYECLLNTLDKYDADVACCGIFNCYETHTIPQSDTAQSFCVSAREALRLQMEGTKISGSLCDKLFKSAIIKDLRFPVGRIYEDAFFTTDYLMRIRTMGIDTTPKYFYHHRFDSLTTSPFKKRDMDVLEAYDRNAAIVEQRYPQLHKQCQFRCLWARFVVLDRMLESSKPSAFPEYRDVVHYLRHHTLNVVSNSCFQSTRRVASLALFTSVPLYAALVHMKNRTNKLFGK